MRESSSKLLYLLWTVIAVLLVGAAIGGYFLVHRINSLSDTNTQLTGDNDSLQRQLQAAKATLPPAK